MIHRHTQKKKDRMKTKTKTGSVFGAALKKLCHQTFCLGPAVFHSMSIRQLSRNNPFINSVRGEKKIKCVCLEVLALVKYWLAFFSSGLPPRLQYTRMSSRSGGIETSARRHTAARSHRPAVPSFLLADNATHTDCMAGEHTTQTEFDQVFTQARAHRRTNTQAVWADAPQQETGVVNIHMFPWLQKCK